MKFFPGENTEFLTLLGGFTVRFAVAETALDVSNTLIFKFCGGDSVQPEVPRSLERKIAFFRQCQSKCSKLATADDGFREWGGEIVREFTDIREGRHFLIHGIGGEVLKDGKIDIMKFRHEKTHFVPEEKTLSLDYISELGDRSFELSKRVLGYTMFLLRFIPTDQLDQLIRELGVEFFRGLPGSNLPGDESH